MATAFAALRSLKHNLDLIQNHPRHTFSFENEQISSLVKSAVYLISFMEECCSVEGAEALERRIARAAHAAEDVIESHVVDQIRGGSTLHGKRTSRFLLDLQKVIEDMEFFRRKASKVAEAQSEFEVEKPTHWEAATSSTSAPTSQKNSNTMVGFDGVLLRLLDVLTNGVPSSRRVIPIMGMAGIGKTTLATNAFQHSHTVHYFEVCLWATISQQYSVEKIILELLSRPRNSSRRTVDELGEELYKSLYGRRYLIVLDDMWTVEAWDGIKFFFPDTSNGSRIVVTTRHLVPHHLSNSRFKIGFLDEGKSWDLFCQKAFAEQVCPLELEEIGKKMVEKCKGLPLAIVVLGGYLRKSSKTLEHWEKVANQMNSILNSAESERCLNILYLSYSNLPVHIKPCFLFMGVFLEDEKILVSDILQLWIAEGFIQARRKCCSLEGIAMAYLGNLVERNLILGVGRRYGRISVCKIHDLVRELCIKIAKEEGFFDVLDTARARIMNRERRAVINHEQAVPEVNHEPQRSAPRVRSLICEGGRLPSELKLLRVVNKVNRVLANEVNFQQVNLRYLNIVLDYKSYRTLYIPSSISLLWNLQTLKITGAYRSIIAPYEIWEMSELRHIEVDPLCLVDPLPMDHSSDEEANDMVLRNLHTLTKVENLRLSEEVCKRIPNIQELEVSYCDLGRDYDEARSYYCPHNLGCFHQLQSLACQFNRDLGWRDFALSLAFPISLKWLSLSGSRFDWDELTMIVGSLPHLLSLQLYMNSVVGSVWTPVEGKFLRLKNLYIQSCEELSYWNAESSHFPVLETISLTDLSKLDEFPSGIGEIPTLRSINLRYCSVASTISAMKIMVEQEELGNEDLRLHVRVRGDKETLESFKQKVQEEGLTTKNIYVRCISKL